MRLKKTEIEEKLNILKAWVNGFDKEDKENFINQLSELEFTSPNKKDVFNAFDGLTPQNTKVLIIGQDPYTDKKYKNKATGYAFLMNKTVTENDSLYYILKAINKNNTIIPKKITEENYTDLIKWVYNNKVLMLNTSLTYKDNSKNMHCNTWKSFIEIVIYNLLINAKQSLSIFLWGKDAQNNFLKILNVLKEKEEISFNGAEYCKNNKNKFKLFKTVKRNKNHIIAKMRNKEIKVYMYSHPSKLNEIKNKPLPFDCTKHFQDEMWKNLLKIYNNA